MELGTPNNPPPSIGRIVLVRAPHIGGGVDLPAIITRVWDHTMINATIFQDGGAPVPQTSIRHISWGDDLYWTWPPRV